jgi:hypothetical protein
MSYGVIKVKCFVQWSPQYVFKNVLFLIYKKQNTIIKVVQMTTHTFLRTFWYLPILVVVISPISNIESTHVFGEIIIDQLK